MKLAMNTMAPILSLLSPIDCFIPALGLPYQYVVVFCLLSFPNTFKSIVSNPLAIPRRLLKYVLGETMLLALKGRVSQAATRIVERFLVSARQAGDHRGAIYLVADLWKTTIAISWLPVFFASRMSALFRIVIIESAILILDDWHSLLNTADTKSDAEITWKVRVLRPVKDVWNWLGKKEWVARLALILFCRLVLGGPPWLYAVCFRLLCLTTTISRPIPGSVLIWLIFEVVCYYWGRGLLPLMYLDRLVVLIPGMLPLQANMVALDGKMTLLGRMQYNLIPPRVLFGVVTTAAI
jgi:hypothetical protein